MAGVKRREAPLALLACPMPLLWCASLKVFVILSTSCVIPVLEQCMNITTFISWVYLGGGGLVWQRQLCWYPSSLICESGSHLWCVLWAISGSVIYCCRIWAMSGRVIYYGVIYAMSCSVIYYSMQHELSLVVSSITVVYGWSNELL